MHLRRLDLVGFKTFADKTALEFSPRITAIVGPNGSGKSNILDAIRWALGEGSLRALRGVRTEDVIFAGSERRRPLALADVTLTLDNTGGSLLFPQGANGSGDPPAALAFAEVTVTRRAVRGGDSQHMVNGLPCRLRDIQTMFLGTGLGGHSYALITQGEVDHLLEATPEDRRMILEEAAGVARYKRRRHDAERRLAAADQLLLRVTDILAEQDAHVAQLAAQADAAQQYQAYTRELRSLEIALQVDEVRRLTRTQRRIRDQLEQVAARRREAEAALRALAEARDALDRRAGEAGREWEEAQRALVLLTGRCAAEEASVNLLAERRRGVDAQRDRISREIDRQRAEESALLKEWAALKEAETGCAVDHHRLEGDAAEAEATLRRLEAEVAREEERVEKAREDVRRLAEDRAHALTEVSAADARAAAYRDRAAALAQRMAHLARSRSTTEACRPAYTARCAETAARLEETRRAIAALRAEHARQVDDREVVLDGLRRIEIERETARSRLGDLEDARAQYRGYDAGAREILVARRTGALRVGGLRGAVAECVHVPPKMRAAADAALGPFRFALIVDSVDDVDVLRRHLRESDAAGEVAFLPVPLLRAQEPLPVPPSVAADPGVCGRALDLVQITGDRPEVVASLLAHVLIVRDLEAALRARAAGFAGRIVTTAGETLSPEGLLTTGPRTGEPGGVVGRAEEITEMREHLARLEATARETAHRAEEATGRLREIEEAAAAAEAGVVREAETRAEAERDLTLLDAEIARLTEETDALGVEQRSLDGEIAALEDSRHSLEAKAGAWDAQITQIEDETAMLAALLRRGAGDLESARARMMDGTVALVALRGKQDALHVRTGEVERSLAQTAARCGDLAEEGRQFDLATARLVGQEEAARQRCQDLAAESARLEKTLTALDAERAGMAARRADLETHTGEAAGRAEALANDAHRAELRQAQVDAEIGSARRRIEEEFGRSCDRLAADVPEAVDRDETLGRMEALRGLINALGPVNLLAIDEHRVAAARADSLRSRWEDTRGAQAALRVLIATLEAVIRERFDTTFRAVNDEFAALFARLFGGGQAGLTLVAVDGSDEPGVEIVVRPPGKTLRSLGALSGGERVMVALALVFAMLRVHPSPFCVFDEVEAALDEANTRKVTDILQELAAHSQIIIITHNKATMEVCDALFGVTMEEPGISRIVSMRLQEHARLPEGQPVG